MTHPPWSNEALYERILDIVAENADVNRATLGPETTLQADLGADFLDVLEIFMLAEEIFDVAVSEESVPSAAPGELHRWQGDRMIGDVVQTFRSALDAPPKPVIVPAPRRRRRFRRNRR